MKWITVFLYSISTLALSQPLSWQRIDAGTNSSFRALSVVSDDIAWLGGTNGTVGLSTDGGKTWKFQTVSGMEKADFRSIYGFDGNKALIANVGSPAYILVTTDGGNSWREVYKNDDPDAFIDGVDFWNDKEGLFYGDPINGQMLMVQTNDGGTTWKKVSTAPQLKEGEASFAASGTGIRCLGKKSVFIATGGKTSRVFFSPDKGKNWQSVAPPIIQGESATGIFSLSANNKSEITIVGGDYQRDTLKVNHVFYTLDGGKNWKYPQSPTRGYRECVEFINPTVAIAVGPTGIDVTNDGGKSWEPLSDERGFHVARKARNGNRVIAAGAKGAIAIMK